MTSDLDTNVPSFLTVLRFSPYVSLSPIIEIKRIDLKIT